MMFFNQVKIPENFSQESLDISKKETIPHCFLNLCQKRPNEKMVFWKDEKGDFSNSLSNNEVLTYAHYFTSLFNQETPKIAIMCSNNPIMLPLELASWMNQGQSISIYDTDTIETIFFKFNLSGANIFACDSKAFNIIKNEDIKNKSNITQIILLEKCEIPDNFEKEKNIVITKLWPSQIKHTWPGQARTCRPIECSSTRTRRWLQPHPLRHLRVRRRRRHRRRWASS